MNYSGNVRYKNKLFFKRLLLLALVVWLLGVGAGILIGTALKAPARDELDAMDTVDAVDGTEQPESTAAIQTLTQQTEPPTEPPQEATEAFEMVSLGVYKVTAYCGCETCCGYWATIRDKDADGKPIVTTASGATAIEGTTIAADTDLHPFGTELMLNGHTYTVQDRGGVILDKSIDIYFDDHEEAKTFGVQYIEVYQERMIEND